MKGYLYRFLNNGHYKLKEEHEDLISGDEESRLLGNICTYHSGYTWLTVSEDNILSKGFYYGQLVLFWHT